MTVYVDHDATELDAAEIQRKYDEEPGAMRQAQPPRRRDRAGHPLGGSGTRLMTTLINHLEASGGRYGQQTMCEGAGMANATIIERV